jgi:raffinose/stachyose/melibiose transport system permease protein
MYTWNDFLLALVMNPSGRMLTAPLALSFFAGAQRVSDQTVVAAAAVLVAIPVIIFYVVLQRHFVRGFLTGAVKE